MSKLSETLVLAQQVSTAATEEASRYDLPQVDVDHLLLALLVGGGPAGALLRGQGITLEAARRATEQVRADHVARLGIVPPPAEPRPIRDPAVGIIDWTPRALRVVGGNESRTDLGLLVGLLDEPSGLVGEVLDRLEADPAQLREAVAGQRVSDRPSRPAGSAREGWRGVTHSGFVPVPVAAVWALVSDPARRPEWDATVGSVEPIRPDLWEMHAAETRPGGGRVRRGPDFVRAHYRRTAFQLEELVEWEVDSLDRPAARSRAHRFAVRLRPASGGSTIELTISWPRRTGWPGQAQALVDPVHRVLAKVMLLDQAASISRVLR